MNSNFDSLVSKLLEDFNIFPRAKGPNTFIGKDMSPQGSLPAGFKGAGLPGIAPGRQEMVLLRLSKKKKKKKTI
jgi:hypothetical protein